MTPPARKPPLAWLVLALQLAALSLGIRWVYPFLTDDALISLRYAERFVQGQGLTWTDGEAVEGYSNLSWVLLSSTLGFFGMDLIDAVRVLGVVCVVWTLVSILRLFPVTSVRDMWPALIGGLFFSLAGPTAARAIGGLETALVVACLVAAFAALAPLVDAQRSTAPSPDPVTGPSSLAPATARFRDWVLASLPLTLLVVTRPDGPMFVAVIAVVVAIGTWQRGRAAQTLRIAAVYIALPFAAWLAQLLFRIAYYGEFLPNTAYVKFNPHPERLAQGLTYIGEGALYALPLLLVALAGAAIGLRDPRRRVLTAVVVTTALVWAAYVTRLGGDNFAGRRHWLILTACAALLAAQAVASFLSRPDRARRTALLAMAVGATLLFVPAQWLDPENQRARRQRWVWDGKVVGEMMGKGFEAEQPYWAINAAGSLPYFSRLPALDMLGLNDHHIARQPPRPERKLAHAHGDGKYVLERKPDIVTFGPPYGLDPTFLSGHQMKTDPRFTEGYRVAYFEALNPRRVENKSFVRLEGKIGIARDADVTIVPAYLSGEGVFGHFTSQGDMISRIVRSAVVESPTIPLGPGAWRVTLVPANPLVSMTLAVREGEVSVAVDDTGARVGVSEHASIAIALHAPYMDTFIDHIRIERATGARGASTALPPRFTAGERVDVLNAIDRTVALGRVTMPFEEFSKVLRGFEGSAEEWIMQADEPERTGQATIEGRNGALINSYGVDLGDGARGMLRTAPFELPERAYMEMRIAGGEARSFHSQVGVRLSDDTGILATFTGEKDDVLRLVRWDLSRYAGRHVSLEIFDTSRDDFAHVVVTDINVGQRYE